MAEWCIEVVLSWCGRHLEQETFIFNHPRITPIIGYIKGFVNDIDPCIVSPRRQGNIAAYITTINPQADRLRLVLVLVLTLPFTILNETYLPVMPGS